MTELPQAACEVRDTWWPVVLWTSQSVHGHSRRTNLAQSSEMRRRKRTGEGTAVLAGAGIVEGSDEVALGGAPELGNALVNSIRLLLVPGGSAGVTEGGKRYPVEEEPKESKTKRTYNAGKGHLASRDSDSAAVGLRRNGVNPYFTETPHRARTPISEHTRNNYCDQDTIRRNLLG